MMPLGCDFFERRGEKQINVRTLSMFLLFPFSDAVLCFLPFLRVFFLCAYTQYSCARIDITLQNENVAESKKLLSRYVASFCTTTFRFVPLNTRLTVSILREGYPSSPAATTKIPSCRHLLAQVGKTAYTTTSSDNHSPATHGALLCINR